MSLEKTYDQLENELLDCVANGDQEIAHIDADNRLKEVALHTNLTYQERLELVRLYDKVSKWYA